MADKNMEAKITVEFEEATSRQQLNSGENISTLFGKIKKLFSDLKSVAFSGSYNDLSDTPDVVTKEYVDPVKSQAAVNRTTLGYQRKNLFDWKNANADESSNITYTKTNTDITVTSTGAWGRVAYKLPALEIGTKYTFSAAVSDLSQASATARIRISYNSEGTNKIVDVNLTKDGEYKAEFTPTESTIYVLFYPNFSSTAYTNSFTASDIMLRYADITDDIYEEYKPSVQEQIIGTYFPMTNSKGLANNTDLNTITEIGNYVCYTGGSAATMTNCPIKAGGFRLIVTNLIVSTNESSTIRYQWIIPNNLDGILCFRRKFDISTNTFNSWYSFGGTVVS